MSLEIQWCLVSWQQWYQCRPSCLVKGSSTRLFFLWPFWCLLPFLLSYDVSSFKNQQEYEQRCVCCIAQATKKSQVYRRWHLQENILWYLSNLDVCSIYIVGWSYTDVDVIVDSLMLCLVQPNTNGGPLSWSVSPIVLSFNCDSRIFDKKLVMVNNHDDCWPLGMYDQTLSSQESMTKDPWIIQFLLLVIGGRDYITP